MTSVPARSVQQDHRIGYVRPGYDADIVAWDSHPLSIGATPLQVYIDGKSTLDAKQVADSLLKTASQNAQKAISIPKMRPTLPKAARDNLCNGILGARGKKLVFTNIAGYLLGQPHEHASGPDLTIVIEDGNISCINKHEVCLAAAGDAHIINLEHGYITPGLTAVSQTLGLVEITGEQSTGDGSVNPKAGDDEGLIDYAKYGIHLEGKGFTRARMGGITKGVTPPLWGGGLIQGISVAYETSDNATILDGGILKEDLALHVTVSQPSKGEYHLCPQEWSKS